MKKINVLDSDTINKIAAGEVVERPMSVVKELVENAVDASASAITVEIKDGGISFIRVTDNGSGIDRDDVENAFLRHATSKIRTAVDLMTIDSLGFRGEALSSIVSVSQVEMITKTHSDLLGVRYLVDGGEPKTREDVGCPDGTTIIVRNLFYNTPARKKFLKTAQTEAGYISDLVNRLALSHPEVSFKFINNDQNKLHTSGNANLKDIIYQIYGRDLTMQLLHVDVHTQLLHISGFLGKPVVSRGNRSWENYFINERYIKSQIVTKAIEDAYKTFVMIHKYPFTALHIEIDPSMIDVNVHPRKMELRFNRNEEVYQQVYEVVRSVLEERELIPSVILSPQEDAKAEEKAPEPFEIQRLAGMAQNSSAARNSGTMQRTGSQIHERQPIFERKPIYDKPKPLSEFVKETFGKSQKEPLHQTPLKETEQKTTRPEYNRVEIIPEEEHDKHPIEGKKPEAIESIPQIQDETPQVKNPEQMQIFDGRLLDERSRLKHRLIGQVFDTYWMIEYDNKLYIIDQHAAHEKVLYEKFLKAFSRKAENSQILSPPVILTLSMSEIELYKKYKDYFSEIGFQIEEFGGKEYAIRAVPLQLFGMNARDIFIEVLDSMSDESRKIEGSEITYKIATMACKAAVKGGNRLSVQEADALITELLEADNPYTCPHGRPTIISISKYEMEKKFKRIQD